MVNAKEDGYSSGDNEFNCKDVGYGGAITEYDDGNPIYMTHQPHQQLAIMLKQIYQMFKFTTTSTGPTITTTSSVSGLESCMGVLQDLIF